MNDRSLPARFGRNTISNYVMTAVMFVVGLLTTPLLTHHLGVERYGIWALTGSIVSYLELLELGFGGSTVAFVARHLAAGDQDLLQRTVNTTLWTLAALGVVAFAVAAIFAAFLPDIVHVGPDLIGQARWLLLILGVDMCLSIPMDTFGGGLIALQRYDLLNATLISVAIFQAIGWVIVLISGGGLIDLGIVTVAISLAGQVARCVLFCRQLPDVRVSPRHFDRTLFGSISRLSSWYAVGEIISGFRENINIVVLGIVRNVATAGIYSVGEGLAVLGGKLAAPMTDLYFPHAAELAGREDAEGLANATIVATRLAAAATFPFCLVVAVLARPAVLTWVGRPFERAVPVVVYLAVAVCLSAVVVVPRRILQGSGQPQLPSLGVLADGTVDIILTVLLGRRYGLIGVAVASLISMIVVQMIVVLPLACRRLGVRTTTLLFSVAKDHVLPVLVAGSLGLYLSRYVVTGLVSSSGRATGVAATLAAGAVVLFVYGLLFAVTGLRADERRRIVGRIRGER